MTESTEESRFVSESHPAEGGCADRAAPFGPSCCPERSAALDSRNCSPPLSARGAAFLDRDGVINDQTAFVNTPDDFRLIPGSASAIRRLNEAGIPVVVVTNQGGIALGYLTEADLAAIHERMAYLLAEEGAHVDKIYYCPHYPVPGAETTPVEGSAARREAGFDPSRRSAEAAPECPDRKPGIGMLERARDELGIDLRKSVLIGDAPTDILAGNRAGCITILVESGRIEARIEAAADASEADLEQAVPDFVCADLWAAVDLLFEALDSREPV